MLIFVRAMQGVGFSIFTTSGNVAASYMVPKLRITAEGLGYYTLGFVLAMSVAPSFALTVVQSHSIQSYKILFIIASVTAFLLLCLLRFSKCKEMNNMELLHIRHEYSLKHLPKTFLGFEKGVFYPAVISFLMTFAYSPCILYIMGFGETKG